MKRTKSIVALVLAVVLIFALSASAFATGNPVNVSIQWDGVEVYSADVYTADVDLYKSQLYPNQTGIYHLYDIWSPVPTGYTVTYPCVYTAGDVLIAAWVKANIELEAYTTATDADGDYVYEWSANTNYQNEHIYGMQFTTYGGLENDGDYYYTTRSEGGNTIYTYVWAGYYWHLYIDDSLYPSVDYGACDYAMSDIDSIVFDYAWEMTDTFELNYLIPGARPYSDLNN